MGAATIGRFIGAVLAECAPVLAEIIADAIRRATADTVEEGATRDALRERLLKRVRDANSLNKAGGASPVQGADAGKDLGSGQTGS